MSLLAPLVFVPLLQYVLQRYGAAHTYYGDRFPRFPGLSVSYCATVDEDSSQGGCNLWIELVCGTLMNPFERLDR